MHACTHICIHVHHAHPHTCFKYVSTVSPWIPISRALSKATMVSSIAKSSAWACSACLPTSSAGLITVCFAFVCVCICMVFVCMFVIYACLCVHACMCVFVSPCVHICVNCKRKCMGIYMCVYVNPHASLARVYACLCVNKRLSWLSGFAATRTNIHQKQSKARAVL